MISRLARAGGAAPTGMLAASEEGQAQAGVTLKTPLDVDVRTFLGMRHGYGVDKKTKALPNGQQIVSALSIGATPVAVGIRGQETVQNMLGVGTDVQYVVDVKFLTGAKVGSPVRWEVRKTF